MNATTYGPRTPALTAARVTRIAKEYAGHARTWTTTTGNDCYLLRLRTPGEDVADELRALNTAARALREHGLNATVVSAGGTRGARVRYMVKVTDPAADAARVAKIGTDRAAALAAAEAEVAAGRDRDHAEALTMDGIREDALTAREARAAYAAEATRTISPAAGVLPTQAEVAEAPLTRRQALTDALPENLGRPRPAGPSAEAVRTAVAQLQRELTAAAPAIGRLLSEPLPGEEEATARARRAAAAAEQAQQAATAAAQEVRLRAVAHYEALAEQALAARVAAEAAWEEEAHAAGFATGDDYAAFLVTETPEPEFADGDDSLPEVVSARMLPPEEPPAAAKLPCYHVTCASGQVYGVAATSVRDALQMTQDRLTGEGSADLPKGAQRVAMWEAAYGTVLHY